MSQESITNPSSLSVLLSRIAHDINTPLTVLSGYVQLLQMNQELTPALQGFVAEIKTACSDLHQITEHLRNFSHAHSLNETVLLDLNQEISQAIQARNQFFSENNIRCEFSGFSSAAGVSGNSMHLKNILSHLFATSYPLLASNGNKWIKISLAKEDKSFVITYSDSNKKSTERWERDRKSIGFSIPKIAASEINLDMFVLGTLVERQLGKVEVGTETKPCIRVVFPESQESLIQKEAA